MLQMSHDVAELMAREKLDRDLGRVVVGCRLCEAGLMQRSWLARRLCQALCVGGRGLVSLGQRLERLDGGAQAQTQLA
jgi:hypothetical protein